MASSVISSNSIDKYVVKWSEFKTVPEKFAFPPEQTGGLDINTPPSTNVPVIDMNIDHAALVQQIMQAAQEFGAFQVINHGVPRELLDEARALFKELFQLPEKDKSRLRPGNADPRCVLAPSSLFYDKEPIHLWREALKQKCTPLEECLPHWPDKPDRYREVVTELINKAKEAGLRIMDLICEGLGLEPGYLLGDLSKELDFTVNHYPPSPDPSRTLGVPKHSDRTVLTLLIQDHVHGLQVCKDGEWVGVEPLPDALAVAMGYILQMVSNGKVKNGDHRVVNNAKEARESSTLFFCPTQDCLIEPAKALVDAENPQVYRPVVYREFLKTYNTRRESKEKFDEILEAFRIKS